MALVPNKTLCNKCSDDTRVCPPFRYMSKYVQQVCVGSPQPPHEYRDVAWLPTGAPWNKLGTIRSLDLMPIHFKTPKLDTEDIRVARMAMMGSQRNASNKPGDAKYALRKDYFERRYAAFDALLCKRAYMALACVCQPGDGKALVIELIARHLQTSCGV